VPGLVEFIEASEPRLIAFNEYVNDAGDEVTVVQIHPDASSMEAYMETVRALALMHETRERLRRPGATPLGDHPVNPSGLTHD
jgi:hypothetical protein